MVHLFKVFLASHLVPYTFQPREPVFQHRVDTFYQKSAFLQPVIVAPFDLFCAVICVDTFGLVVWDAYGNAGSVSLVRNNKLSWREVLAGIQEKLGRFECLRVRRAAWPSQYISYDFPIQITNQLTVEPVHFSFAGKEVVWINRGCLVEVNKGPIKNAECIETI